MTKATNALRMVVGEVFTNRQAMHDSPTGIALDVLGADHWWSNERMVSSEGRAFAAAFYWRPLRMVVRCFWLVYRFGRWRGVIPAASNEPWN